MRERVAEILRGLPVLPERAGDVDRLAERIVAISRFARVNELPRATRVTSGRAEAEVEQLAVLALQLHDHILGMHRTTHAAFEADPAVPGPLAFLGDLDELLRAADIARTRIVGTDFETKPRKFRAERTAVIAGIVYRHLTGLEPIVATRDGEAYGRFLELVADLFEALNINASAEVYARRA